MAMMRIVKLATAAAALAPIAALALLAFFWGNFPGAASAVGATAAQLILLFLLAAGGAGWRRRPLDRETAAALFLLWLAAVLATCLSEVPRAGRCALALLPVFGILPRLFGYLFAVGSSLRLAARALSALLAVTAAWGLWGAIWGGTPGASLPLGHHNLLAVFLVMLLPAPLAIFLAAIGWTAPEPPAREQPAYGHADYAHPVSHAIAPWEQWLALAAAALGALALLATRSLGGGLALAAFLLLMLPRERWTPRAKPAMAVAGLAAALLLVALAPRLFAGGDLGLSIKARWSYLGAGLAGFFDSPWVGHGAGSTPWLVADYFAPRVAVHPPEHIVGDLHNLPLQVLFELGLFGFAAAALWLWAVLRPIFKAPLPEEPFRAALLNTSRAGLIAALVFSSTGFLLSVPALPLAFVLLAGLARATVAPSILASGGEHTASRRVTWLASVAMALAAVGAFFWLLPGLRAQGAWDRARAAEDESQARWALEEAVALDPTFPLYRARLGVVAAVPEQLVKAQRDAHAAGPLTLLAALGAEADALPEARELLERACDLDPFGGLAPFRLAVGPAGGSFELRVERAMRALVAEPRLVAAAAWRGQAEVLQRAQVRLDREGPPVGWSASLLPSMQKILGPAPGPLADLVLTVDRDPAEALSLVVFRRSPWRSPLARVPVYPEGMPPEMRPAVSEQEMRPDFAAPGCHWRPPG